MARLNLNKLRRDVEVAAADLLANRPGAQRRKLTGAMAVVRENLKEIEALKAAGKSWIAIAAALAEQGVTQGNNQPLTAKRLTALIASVKRQAAGRVAKEEARGQRRDLPSKQSPKSHDARLRLADELTHRGPGTRAPASMTEEEIRLANFDKHSLIFRKDNP